MSVHLLGDEMLGWSDLDGRHGPGPVRGPATAALLAEVCRRPDLPAGRALVVGPHAPELIDVLDQQDLTLLVRGLPDAEALAARYADRPGVRVCCGSPEGLAALPAYDTVIALGGLARLSSVEGPELTWGEAFDLLLTVLRPGGRLLLAVENFLGTHRLLAPPLDFTDSDWAAPGEYDDTRPAGLARLRRRLAEAGLHTIGTWAAFPTPLAPAALLGPELLTDPTVSGFLRATSSGQLFADGTDHRGPVERVTGVDHGGPVERVVEAGRPMLVDPGRVVAAAIRHGAATELAPGWILLAERRPAVSPDGSGPAGVLWHAGRLREIHPEPNGGWRFADGGSVPSGRTVEDLVVAGMLRRDLPAVRGLLTAWQGGAEAGVPADQVVVSADGTRHALAGAAEPAQALRRLADRLVEAGLAPLWPAGELVTTLATMAGRVPEVSAEHTRHRVCRGWRELLVDRDRLAHELGEARALQEWYERTLTERDDELKRLRRIVSLLSGTPTARAGRILLASARTARAALRHLRTPD